MSNKLKSCPHCGGHPAFEYRGWDTNHYVVSASLICCTELSVFIGWQLANEMQHDQLVSELLEMASHKWNKRYEAEPAE